VSGFGMRGENVKMHAAAVALPLIYFMLYFMIVPFSHFN